MPACRERVTAALARPGARLYGSPTLEGYVGNVMGIFDLKNPEKPDLVGRWHMPGQWTAGGETPS